MIQMEQEKEDLQLNMAPMIDMIFLLIIFFLTATTFTEKEREQDVLLPNNKNPGSLSRNLDNNIIINVKQDGALFVMGKKVESEQLVAMLRERKAEMKKQNSKLKVMVRGDRRALVEAEHKALEAAEKAGISKIFLVTKILEIE